MNNERELRIKKNVIRLLEIHQERSQLKLELEKLEKESERREMDLFEYRSKEYLTEVVNYLKNHKDRDGYFDLVAHAEMFLLHYD